MTGSVVVVCMEGMGHVKTLLPLVAGLRSRGLAVHMATHRDVRTVVERAGADFVDLYEGRPIEAADARSIPIPSRYVTFAGVYAESLAAQIGDLGAGLVVYDSFAMVAMVAARRLGVPYVCVCPHHAPVPSRMLAALHRDPRVATSEECLAAVERLRDVHGIVGANPFSYFETLSPYLNVYCEPAEFLDPEDRAVFEPLAFFGGLLPGAPDGGSGGAFPSARHGPRVYVSFGTVVWWYYEAVAKAALEVIVTALVDRDVDVLISLGGHPLDPADRDRLVRPNVRVETQVDQWAVLAEADAFVTHHGVGSTHESIYREVPMISYPFFGDQPALARRCQELGLAVPLGAAPQAPVEPSELLTALGRLADEHDRFEARLAEARSWELRTIAERDAVLDAIVSLTAGDG